MSIREAIIETFKREAWEEGYEEGREKGYKDILEVIDRLKKDEKESDIAKAMNINIAIVKKVKKKFQSM